MALLLRKKEISLFLRLSDLKPQDVFQEILDDDYSKGEELEEFLTKFSGSKSQINYFLQLIHLTSEITKWTYFIEHEQSRRESKWKDSIFKEFADKLQIWINKPYDPGSKAVDNTLQKLINSYAGADMDVTEEIYKNWRIDVLRKAIYDCLLKALEGKTQ